MYLLQTGSNSEPYHALPSPCPLCCKSWLFGFLFENSVENPKDTPRLKEKEILRWGLDLFGLVGPECRCGASAINRQIWHGATPKPGASTQWLENAWISRFPRFHIWKLDESCTFFVFVSKINCGRRQTCCVVWAKPYDLEAQFAHPRSTGLSLDWLGLQTCTDDWTVRAYRYTGHFEAQRALFSELEEA